MEGVRVLDPACGSGAFLYVALEGLLDLEKRARIWMEDAWGEKIEGRIRPEHLLGLELNAYAHDLAQITVWIGFLQWQRANGYPFPDDPILRHTNNIAQGDALLDDSQGLEAATERQWPPAEFIVGNPPFLGGKLLRRQLGNEYVDTLFRVFKEQVAAESDFVCYWFEKARAQIEAGATKRAGLVATQNIRGIANRKVLARIKESGDIFFAVPDRKWKEGRVTEKESVKRAKREKAKQAAKIPNVNVSFVGFDNGTQIAREIEGVAVAEIHPDLTGGLDMTAAVALKENESICFMGDTKGGAFDISLAKAEQWLSQPNPQGRPNSDVLTPWVNGLDLKNRPLNKWIIDFGSEMSREEAELYELPFAFVSKEVRPKLEKNTRDTYAESWWRHVEARPALLAALSSLPRFIVTNALSKHRIFKWMESPTLPDHQLFVFARSDDYSFGILHSRVHELWALRTGTRQEDRPRYTPTTCFDKFPFPQPTEAQHKAISEAALKLHEVREAWLHPAEWMREESIEFRASINGPWRHLVREADARGIGTARWTRLVLRPEAGVGSAFSREKTLTNLYNTRPAWLSTLHTALDAAVLAAYGLAADAGDNEILALLLDLNLSRASVR